MWLAPREAFAQDFGDDGAGAVQIHGFVSEGGFVSTSNDFIGSSSDGTLALFEAGVNVQAEVADRLRVGVQLFGRKVGDIETEPRIDWGFLDYAWRPWLGLRAGVVKMPFGLYNEYADVDAARLSILPPNGIYGVRSRDLVLSATGLAIYGGVPLGCGGAYGELEYQAWLGSLTIPRNAVDLVGAELVSAESKYVVGGQVFWRPTPETLRFGVTAARATIDYDLLLDQKTIDFLVTVGVVPADYDGAVHLAQRPVQLGIASVEYLRGDWTFAGEYARTWTRRVTDLAVVLPETHFDTEAFYVSAARRTTEQIEVGAYYSVEHADTGDRLGREGVTTMRWPKRWHGFQRDAAVTLRYDVNDHWLWKLEAHFIDGTSALTTVDRLDSDRFWGLFLFKTTVTF